MRNSNVLYFNVVIVLDNVFRVDNEEKHFFHYERSEENEDEEEKYEEDIDPEENPDKFDIKQKNVDLLLNRLSYSYLYGIDILNEHTRIDTINTFIVELDISIDKETNLNYIEEIENWITEVVGNENTPIFMQVYDIVIEPINNRRKIEVITRRKSSGSRRSSGRRSSGSLRSIKRYSSSESF